MSETINLQRWTHRKDLYLEDTIYAGEEILGQQIRPSDAETICEAHNDALDFLAGVRAERN